jgi:hypothetical protein
MFVTLHSLFVNNTRTWDVSFHPNLSDSRQPDLLSLVVCLMTLSVMETKRVKRLDTSKSK